MNGARPFTLLEVVLALAVLAIGLLAAMALQNTAVLRVAKARDAWNRQHRLAQALEFHLLAGPKAPLPATVFDYPGWRAACTVAEPEGLPAGVPAVQGQWRLATVTVDLIQDGQTVDAATVDMLLRSEDLE
jgi:type II secretory pathway pseudopilin PulG